MGKKLGRPKRKYGIHNTCMSFDKELYEEFKKLATEQGKKSITAFLEELMLAHLAKQKEQSQQEERSKVLED